MLFVDAKLLDVQVGRPALSPIVSPTESPRTSLDQTEAPAQQQQQQTRLQNGTPRLTTAISAVTVSSDGGGGSEPVSDLLIQYSSRLYSSSPRPLVEATQSSPAHASGHGNATAAEVAAVAAAFGDYDAEGSSAADAYSEAQQSGAPMSPFVPARSGSGSSGGPPMRSGSGSSASPESPKLTNRRLESVIKPPRHSKRRRCRVLQLYCPALSSICLKIPSLEAW